MEEIKDDKGKIIKQKIKEKLLIKMYSLSLRQRTFFMNKKKIFYDKIKEEAIQNFKLRHAQKMIFEQ